MELISLQGKTCACSHSNERVYTLLKPYSTVHNRNFFEKRVAEYQKANVMSSVQSSDSIITNTFSLEADF